jgi:hypothetical protein
MLGADDAGEPASVLGVLMIMGSGIFKLLLNKK